MRLDLELALRFLRRRTGALLRGTALAAFFGVALATAALVVTLALMRGYTGAIATALQRGNAHIVGFAPAGLELDEARALTLRMRAVDGVRRASPVTYLTGLLNDPTEPSNPIPVTLKAVADPPAYTHLEAWPADTRIPAVVGRRLADTVGAETGSILALRLPPDGNSWVLPTLALSCVGTFQLEFSEFDAHWIVVPLDRVLTAVPRTHVAGIEIELDDPFAIDEAVASLEAIDGRFLFTDWRDMNRPMFAALAWQTRSLFVVLTLVVAVASFQVASAMVVLSIDKRRAAGMLQALGSTPARVRRVLLLAGALLGWVGVAAGLAGGCVASWMMNTFDVIHFPDGLAEVYMVDSIALKVTPLDVILVVAVCSALVIGASLIPAWRTARMDPVEALRAV